MRSRRRTCKDTYKQSLWEITCSNGCLVALEGTEMYCCDGWCGGWWCGWIGRYWIQWGVLAVVLMVVTIILAIGFVLYASGNNSCIVSPWVSYCTEKKSNLKSGYTFSKYHLNVLQCNLFLNSRLSPTLKKTSNI